MGGWRRGARPVSGAELRELLLADHEELAAVLARSSSPHAAHRVRRRDAGRQLYLTWLQRELHDGVSPSEMTPEELNALIIDWQLRRVRLVKDRRRGHVTALH
jgi:hypothetical protein